MTVNTQELRELLEKATPGPWFHGAKNGEHKYCVYDKVCWTDDDGRHGETPNMVVRVSPDDGKYHDAAYIAAANPATVSALLDEIDALRAELQARQWISVEDRLPEPGAAVMVYTPPQPEDWPDQIRIGFDHIDPESDGDVWHGHAEHYEHYCCVAKGGDVAWIGPSEKAPYTHWMPLLPPAPPQGEAA